MRLKIVMDGTNLKRHPAVSELRLWMMMILGFMYLLSSAFSLLQNKLFSFLGIVKLPYSVLRLELLIRGALPFHLIPTY